MVFFDTFEYFFVSLALSIILVPFFKPRLLDSAVSTLSLVIAAVVLLVSGLSMHLSYASLESSQVTFYLIGPSALLLALLSKILKLRPIVWIMFVIASVNLFALIYIIHNQYLWYVVYFILSSVFLASVLTHFIAPAMELKQKRFWQITTVLAVKTFYFLVLLAQHHFFLESGTHHGFGMLGNWGLFTIKFAGLLILKLYFLWSVMKSLPDKAGRYLFYLALVALISEFSTYFIFFNFGFVI